MDYGSLTLSRKPHETLLLTYSDENGEPQQIMLTVNSLDGNKVRLNIEAHKAVNIVRGELLLP